MANLLSVATRLGVDSRRDTALNSTVGRTVGRTPVRNPNRRTRFFIWQVSLQHTAAMNTKTC